MGHDYSKVHFKVNASGSWANLMTVDAERLKEAKKACEALACLHKSSGLRFRAIDDAGGVIEQYGQCGSAGMYAWHEPKRRG